MDEDEIAAAVRHFYAANPTDPIPAGCDPVAHFPPLPQAARTRHPSQWVKMRRAVARLARYPADPGHILAFEAGTYIAHLQATCDHRMVTVTDLRQRPYSECALCGLRGRP